MPTAAERCSSDSWASEGRLGGGDRRLHGRLVTAGRRCGRAVARGSRRWLSHGRAPRRGSGPSPSRPSPRRTGWSRGRRGPGRRVGSRSAGSWPYRWGARATITWRRENTLRRARSPSSPRTSDTEPAGLLQGHRPTPCLGRPRPRPSALDRPAGGFELRAPAAHQLPLCLVLFGRPGGAGGHASRLVGHLAPALAFGLDLGCPLRVQLRGPRRGCRRSANVRADPRDRDLLRSRSRARRLPAAAATRPTIVAACRCSRHSVVSAAFHPPRSSPISTRFARRT
jgi:hypothetical protein